MRGVLAGAPPTKNISGMIPKGNPLREWMLGGQKGQMLHRKMPHLCAIMAYLAFPVSSLQTGCPDQAVPGLWACHLGYRALPRLPAPARLQPNSLSPL